jgi:ATP-dependent helicase/nuclease subunit A
MTARDIEAGFANQRAAANPDNSVWVVANAGSGKTYVLTSRIVRLLLAGARPSAILCLTFTKAAAAEMRDRLSRLLAKWATLDEKPLADELLDRLGRAAEAGELRHARTLFAQVIDAPGSLRIQTIHSFCEGLLKRFPVESGVPPHFSVADEGTGKELLHHAREILIADSAADPVLAEALKILSTWATEGGFRTAIDALLADRRRLRRLLDAKDGNVAAAVADLYGALGVAPGETRDAAFAAHRATADIAALSRAVAALESGKVTDKEIAASLKAALQASLPAAGIDDWIAAFKTKTGDSRKKLVTKDVEAAHPGTGAALLAEQRRVEALHDRLLAIMTAEPSAALLRLGAALFDRYDRLKKSRALLDYDDLILRAVALLKGTTPWVQYKLDGGIDHVLVDEAQDTAPEQWEAVGALIDEFFAGAGARESRPPRSVFVVGDEKQSIFSFQGADLATFERTRAAFQAKVGQRWAEVPLEVSFRSAPAVLDAVDHVFSVPDNRDGVVSGARTLMHRARRAGAGGRVELWEPMLTTPSDPPSEWDAPVDYLSTEHPSVRLAARIALTVKGWIGTEDLPARGRKVRAGDVLVLVRRRNRFFDACVRAFKDADVAVAGADRMVLVDQIAVMDLLSLARFCLLPADDLSLAEILKSPLYGFDDDDLFALAWRRKRHLWATLRARADERPKWRTACDELTDMLSRADFVAPYELYAGLLNARDGRRRMLARLGPDAADPLDEFLAACLSYERAGVPSLQGFLAWFESGATDLKRDMEQGRDEVRVMTVHGAKGLEADIVFLPDTCTPPGMRGSVVWAGGLPLWPPRGTSNQTLVSAARAESSARELAEYRRLLYVAMTRARDRLYVCGWAGDKGIGAGSWYARAAPALQTHPQAVEIDTPDGKVWRIEQPTREVDGRAEADAGKVVAAPLPSWARDKTAPAEPSPPRPLAPSRPEGEPAVASPLGTGEGFAFLRGKLIHRLLQTLPDLATGARADAARRLLSRPAYGLTPAQVDELAGETLAVLAHPEFAAAFDGPGLAEAAVVASIGGRALSGRIDRLVVRDEAVYVIDFKTNRPPPEDVSGVAPVYLAQLAAYRAALAPLFAGRAIRCALLWTHAPRLMPIPPELLDRHAPN